MFRKICLVCIALGFFLAEDQIVHCAYNKSVNENSYAIVIGIEKYRDIVQAPFAANDAKAVHDVLIKKMNYPHQNVLLLLNERATKADLEKYLLVWLKNRINDQSAVFIYYSGHGAPDPSTGDPYIVPYDGDPNYIGITGYPIKRLYQNLSNLPTNEIFIVIDSCFSGAGERSVLAYGSRPIIITIDNPLYITKNMIVFTSSKKNQISTSHPVHNHGLFTYYFLDGLKGEADLNQDGGIEIGELFKYLKPKVETAARLKNIEQTPTIFPSSDIISPKLFKKLIFKLKTPLVPAPRL